VLTLTASGRGTFDDPQLTATAQIPRFQVRDASISGIKGQVNIANHQAHATLDSEVAATSVQVRATVNLNDGHYTRASLDTQGMPIEGLLALYSPAKSNGPHGVVEVHASAEGPLDDRNRIQGQVIVPTLKADYQGLQIGNSRPIRVHYANSLIALDPTEIVGTDTNLRATATSTFARINKIASPSESMFVAPRRSSRTHLDCPCVGIAQPPSPSARKIFGPSRS